MDGSDPLALEPEGKGERERERPDQRANGKLHHPHSKVSWRASPVRLCCAGAASTALEALGPVPWMDADMSGAPPTHTVPPPFAHLHAIHSSLCLVRSGLLPSKEKSLHP